MQGHGLCAPVRTVLILSRLSLITVYAIVCVCVCVCGGGGGGGGGGRSSLYEVFMSVSASSTGFPEYRQLNLE